MKYKGWVILALINMPRAFYIKNTRENGHIDYGKEEFFADPPKPKDHRPYAYVAQKGDRWLRSDYSLSGLKKLIDNEQNS